MGSVVTTEVYGDNMIPDDDNYKNPATLTNNPETSGRCIGQIMWSVTREGLFSGQKRNCMI